MSSLLPGKRKWEKDTAPFPKIRRISPQPQYAVLDPDILEAVLAYMDLDRLKICRLVCKDWNLEACRILRQRAVCRLQSVHDFSKFSALIKKGCRNDLPSPIKMLHLTPFVSQIDILNRLTTSPQFLISRLHVENLFFEDQVDQKTVSLIIWECAPKLVALKTADRNLVPGYDKVQLKFPFLQELSVIQLWDFHLEPLEAAEFLVHVIDTSQNLTTLDFQCTLPDNNSLQMILRTCTSLKRIKSFSVTNISNPNEFCKLLAQVQLESLTSLRIETHNENLASASLLAPILGKISKTVKSLDFQIGNQINLPHCPAVTKLCITDPQVCDLTKFPGLTEVSFRKISVLDFQSDPFTTVREVSLESVSSGATNSILSLFTLFPNCNRLSLPVTGMRPLWIFLRMHPEIRIKSIILLAQGRIIKDQCFCSRKDRLSKPQLQELEYFGIRNPNVAMDFRAADFNIFPNLKTLEFYNSSHESVAAITRASKKVNNISLIYDPYNMRPAWSIKVEQLLSKSAGVKFISSESVGNNLR